MSMAGESKPLDLDALTDEVIALHRLATPQQPVGAAVHDFVRLVGRSREALVLRELIAEKIRDRVRERLQEAMTRPRQATTIKRDPGPAPLRFMPAAEETPDTLDPDPASPEEFRPGSMLIHTTETDRAEPDVAAQAPAVPVPVPDVLAGLIHEDADTPTVRVPSASPFVPPVVPERPAPAPQQPSRRMASFRNTTPEETWPALAELVDVGGVSKRHADVTRDDQIVRIAFLESAEKEASKDLTEANKRYSAAHQEMVQAKREMDAMRRHDVETIGELPDYEKDRLYGRRAA